MCREPYELGIPERTFCRGKDLPWLQATEVDSWSPLMGFISSGRGCGLILFADTLGIGHVAVHNQPNPSGHAPWLDLGFFQHHYLRVHTAITWDLHQLSILHILGSSQQSITLVSRGPNAIFCPLRAPALLCTDTCIQTQRERCLCTLVNTCTHQNKILQLASEFGPVLKDRQELTWDRWFISKHSVIAEDSIWKWVAHPW